MHKILFRGQTRRKGQKVWMDGSPVDSNWVYGGIFPGTGTFSIIYGEDHMELSVQGLGKHIVYSDTVGEYIGFPDKNNTMIFEGDIALFDDDLVIIEYCQEDAMFIARCLDGTNWRYDFSQISGDRLEVIGNIYDNPELLEADI